ncbi:MAG: DUF4089 domain-containing protein [Symploca sp. SIO1C4]|uniref:DUF4089 domain-containing protein n=1 Tax=Symploca sp. SIO1C4 TaxID=2607765 RepID=A0A6B3NE58_9CYAN|nr:DUF4089 domain-containing protein [Symploca sp. SIO1C4]NET06993.1 DUF4089 domain-containing protein [Symploca sp. SIO2B6]NET50668.1 DUF4089 domain-containing protein [Merismopedia sp. SIO2A8]
MEENIDFSEYVKQMAKVLDLPIAPKYFPSVVENFARVSTIASVVMEFPLPEDVEAAPVFEVKRG